MRGATLVGPPMLNLTASRLSRVLLEGALAAQHTREAADRGDSIAALHNLARLRSVLDQLRLLAGSENHLVLLEQKESVVAECVRKLTA
jgi:hypothetical protein